VFLHAGIKFPYFVFFAKDKGLRPGETHKSMLLAMGFMAFLCLFLGLYPQPLYHILPFQVHYQAYTFGHVVSQLQLLMFSALVFFLFLPLLKRTETISIDTDWFYRKGGRLFYQVMDRGMNGINRASERFFVKGLTGILCRLAGDLTARVVLLAAVSYWLLKGVPRNRLRVKKQEIYADILEGTLPIGIGAGLATLFVVIVFILI